MKMKKLVAGLLAVVTALGVAFAPAGMDVAMAATKKAVPLKIKVDGASSKKWKMKDEYYKAVKDRLKKHYDITVDNSVIVFNGDKLSFTFELDAKRKKQLAKLWITELPPLYRDAKNKLQMMDFGWDDAPLAENTYYNNGKLDYTERDTGIYVDKKNTYKISPNEVYLVSATFDTNGDGYWEERESALIVSSKYKAYVGKMTPNWEKSGFGEYVLTAEKYKKFKKTFCNIQFSNGTKQAAGKKVQNAQNTRPTKPDIFCLEQAKESVYDGKIEVIPKGAVMMKWYNIVGKYSYKVCCKIGNGEYEEMYTIPDSDDKAEWCMTSVFVQPGEKFTYKIIAVGENGKTIEGKEKSIQL